MIVEWKRTVAVGTTVVLMACGGASRQEQAAEHLEEGAKQIEKAISDAGGSAKAADMAKGLESMAKGLGALAGGDPNAKPVDPVSFRDLMTVFPETFSGWERKKPTGERMSSPVNFSQAEVDYTKENARLEIKIMDSALNQMLIAPFAMFLTAGYEKETSRGYEKSVKVGDFPGWEEWNDEGKDGSLHAVVDKRFIVDIRGNNIESPKVLHDLAAAMDLKKLSTLKSAAQ